MTTKNNLDPLARMRAMDAANALPPTEAESFEYIQTLVESSRPLPTRHGGNLLMWLLVFGIFVFLSGTVFNASRAEGQSPAVNVCIEALVEDINPALMSKTTATREARQICNGLRRMAPNFFRALTQ